MSSIESSRRRLTDGRHVVAISLQVLPEHTFIFVYKLDHLPKLSIKFGIPSASEMSLSLRLSEWRQREAVRRGMGRRRRGMSRDTVEVDARARHSWIGRDGKGGEVGGGLE